MFGIDSPWFENDRTAFNLFAIEQEGYFDDYPPNDCEYEDYDNEDFYD